MDLKIRTVYRQHGREVPKQFIGINFAEPVSDLRKNLIALPGTPEPIGGNAPAAEIHNIHAGCVPPLTQGAA